MRFIELSQDRDQRPLMRIFGNGILRSVKWRGCFGHLNWLSASEEWLCCAELLSEFLSLSLFCQIHLSFRPQVPDYPYWTCLGYIGYWCDATNKYRIISPLCVNWLLCSYVWQQNNECWMGSEMVCYNVQFRHWVSDWDWNWTGCTLRFFFFFYYFSHPSYFVFWPVSRRCINLRLLDLYGQLVGLLGRGINSVTKPLLEERNTNPEEKLTGSHASSRFRTHDPIVCVVEDILCLR
jgi:hypothetical protein